MLVNHVLVWSSKNCYTMFLLNRIRLNYWIWESRLNHEGYWGLRWLAWNLSNLFQRITRFMAIFPNISMHQSKSQTMLANTCAFFFPNMPITGTPEHLTYLLSCFSRTYESHAKIQLQGRAQTPVIHGVMNPIRRVVTGYNPKYPFLFGHL